MQDPLLLSLVRRNSFPALLPVNLTALPAKQLACLLVSPPAQLVIDCGWLRAPHPWGVGRFVSQLLQLHRRGAGIWLCNVHPVLARCVCCLQLDALFHLER